MKTKELIARLKYPTEELVREYQEEFSKDYGVEDKMQKLIVEKVYDKDTYEAILLTAIIINELYSTNIRRIKIMAWGRKGS